MFHTISDDVILQHIVPYLTLDDTANLDHALADFPLFGELVLPGDRQNPLSCNVISWMINRRIRTRSVRLGGSVDGVDVCNLIKARCFESLQHLDLSWCNQLHTACYNLLLISLQSSSLIVIDLSGCVGIKDSFVAAVARNCPKLQVWTLHQCSVLTDKALLAIASHSTQLRCLDIGGCDKVTDDGVIAIARCCGQLEELYMPWCNWLTDLSLVAVARHCSELHTLDAMMCTKITNTSVECVARKCPQLLQLRLHGCCKITNRSLVELAKHSYHLQNLCIESCSLITDEAIVSVAQKCRELQYLDVSFCRRLTDTAVAALWHHRQLVTISLTGCKLVTAAALKRIAERFQVVC